MEDGLANLKEPLRTGLVLHQVQEDICTEDSIKMSSVQVNVFPSRTQEQVDAKHVQLTWSQILPEKDAHLLFHA